MNTASGSAAFAHVRRIAAWLIPGALVPSMALCQSRELLFPVRDFASAPAVSPAFRHVTDVIEVGPNAVLVHDSEARRVVLLDSTMRVVRVVLDSAHDGSAKYGGQAGRLITYHTDSAMFLDPATTSILVLDRSGRIARTTAIPRHQESGAMVTVEPPRVDTEGRLVYRIGLRGLTAAALQRPSGGRTTPDTAGIIRVHLETRRVDTIARVKFRQWPGIARMRDTVTPATMTNVNPLEPLDDWTVLADGSVAVIRGAEYRVEFIRLNGTRELGPKVPYEWIAINDSVKVEFIAYLEREQETRIARERAERAGKPPLEPREIGAAMRRASNGELDVPNVRYQFVDPMDLPNFRPAIAARGAHPSPENTVWVRTFLQTGAGAGIVYDVLDSSGRRVDRVRLPEGRTLAALGRDAAYVTVPGAGGTRLERVARAP